MRTIDICTLSVDELLGMLRGFINTMCIFALNTRNVHKELKETLASFNKLLKQHIKVINKGRNKDNSFRVQKSAETQTQVNYDADKASNAMCTKEASTDTPCWWQGRRRQSWTTAIYGSRECNLHGSSSHP